MLHPTDSASNRYRQWAYSQRCTQRIHAHANRHLAATQLGLLLLLLRSASYK